MILNTLYCDNNNRCYFLAVNLINEMTEECKLDLVSKEFEDGLKSNILITKEGSIVYHSDNPLKIVDFLKGYKKAIENKNNIIKK